MYNMKRVIGFIIILFLNWSCHQKKNQVNDNYTSSLLTKHFTDSELADINVIMQYVENGMCEEKNAEDIARCYDMHCHTLRSDVFNKMPITLNYPYNSPDGLHSIGQKDKLKLIWNYDCKYVNDKTKTEVHYYCYNLEGSYISYLEDLAQNNKLIKIYVETIVEKNGLNNELIREIMINSVDDLEFSNVDHRIFYTMHYLTQRDQTLKYKALVSL